MTKPALIDLSSRVVAGSPAVDTDVIAQLRWLDEEGRPSVVPELVAMFLRSTESRVATMDALIVARDASALSRAAHSLKSSSAQLGAFGMRDVCARLEDLKTSDRLHEADRLLALLREEFKVVTRALRRFAI